MSGQIVLASTKKELVATLIRFFTKSKFSHAFITMPDMVGYPMCIEAAMGGIDTLRFDTGYMQNSKESIEIWEVNLPDEAKLKGMQAAINRLETTYGFLELPFFAFRGVCKMLGMKNTERWNNWANNGIICSQLCQIYLTAAGLGAVFAEYGKDAVSPQDLSEIMAEHPKFFKKVYSNFQ